MTAKFECDTVRLESRIKYATHASYLALLCGVLVYNFQPEWLSDVSQWLGLMIAAALFMALNTIEKHSRGDLDCHRSEVILVSGNSLEFHQASSGYKFTKKLDEIDSVTFTQWLGVPCIKVRFRDNQFYEFRWFKDSIDLYQVLKGKEAWLK